ncbi:endolysin [Arthrobacter phage Constance]|uniref:Lysin A n=1 Tax=Arthrobacter phage Constance TaxID=2419950 RepID=A0A3G2KER3_9CAUD|nr:endolysin [Arthrobacter phage Constance]AYN57431.1 lysin A [Arthrobacter phage Constance]WMI32966.1 endolysin [Arthrobacter phage PeggyLeg03]
MTTGYLLVDQPNPTTPQGTFPRRGTRGKLTGTCIVHTSEGAWQAGVDSLTNQVRTRTDYGCYHRACDWQDIALYYPWEWEAWQDSETNNWAVGIAAACRTSDWAIMPADIREGFYRNMARMAADFVTYMKAEHGITVPLVRLSGEQARAGVPGFCAHGDSGISRTDPGADFNWTLFFTYTRQALAGITAQGGTTAPVKKESEMPTSKRVDSAFKARHRLPKGKAYTLSVKDDGGSANFAVNGAGHYLIHNHIRGEGLLPGQRIKAQFFITKGGKTSGHFAQDIVGTIDGTFDQPVEFNRAVETGTTLTCLLTSSNTETAYITGFGAEVTTWKA